MLLTTEPLWQDFHAPLRQFIRTQVQDEQQTDDLLQEVFLKIHTHLDTVRTQDKVGSWLYQIARHVVSNFYRSRQSQATTTLPDNLAERLMEPEEDEENEAVQSLLPCILPLVQRLPQPYRHALLLTEVEGVSQKELATRLGLSFSGAKSRVQRARDKLRELLLECCHSRTHLQQVVTATAMNVCRLHDWLEGISPYPPPLSHFARFMGGVA